MKNLILALAATLSLCTLAQAGTPKGVLNPDGSTTYTVTGNQDVPVSPVPLESVEIAHTGNGSYKFQPLAFGLVPGDRYAIAWDQHWQVELEVSGQPLAAVGGHFAGAHSGSHYFGNPEHVQEYTAPVGVRVIDRSDRLLNAFHGGKSEMVGLEWFANRDLPPSSVTAWGESTGYVGTGAAYNALEVEFSVTYYPATL